MWNVLWLSLKNEEMTSQCQFKMITVAGAKRYFSTLAVNGEKILTSTTLNANYSEFTKLVHKPRLSRSSKSDCGYMVRSDRIKP